MSTQTFLVIQPVSWDIYDDPPFMWDILDHIWTEKLADEGGERGDRAVHVRRDPRLGRRRKGRVGSQRDRAGSASPSDG